MYEFWRFVFVQQEVAKFGATFVEFPPMQQAASFNLEAVKEQIMKAIQAHPAKKRHACAGAVMRQRPHPVP